VTGNRDVLDAEQLFPFWQNADQLERLPIIHKSAARGLQYNTRAGNIR